MSKRALITGITGQDGSYLAELLLAKGYEVHGLVRRASTFGTTQRIDQLHNWGRGQGEGRLELHYGDLADSGAVMRVLASVRPDEIYNLAAQSHVRVSFDVAEYTAEITGLGTLRVLECIRNLGLTQHTRFYQASSSELYGLVRESPQTETTPFHPRSPYACAKAFAHYATVNYRESYGLHASCGILFNHESPRRGENFVTRKITLGLARIAAGLQDKIALGNLEARRDWGFAGDYVDAMWRMLQQDAPDDYVIATGETHSVREFLDEAAAVIGGGMDWTKHVVIDARHYRPAEVDLLVGDASKAKRVLGWTPRVSFRELVRMMVEADVAAVRAEGDRIAAAQEP
ncbi:MAG TPA: GDP-mannose 4,6-dehydratase [Gemmatimonadaceae bacterium]|jgi:GDPmannose 4,6-dehydratase